MTGDLAGSRHAARGLVEVGAVTPPGDAPVLETRDVCRTFGGLLAVDHVSIAVPPGRVVGLIGPNGAGKSTLMAILAGAQKPDEGTVRFLGEDVTREPPFRRAQRGLCRTFQLSGDLPRLTVLENLLLAAPRQRGERLLGALAGPRVWKGEEELLVVRARGLLNRFDMRREEDSYVAELSGGQRRLVEIMRALMASPRLLLLDEPFAGVNPSLARRIESHLIDLRDHDGLTMVLVEHELGVVERCCDPVVVMAMGRVIAQGTMADVRTREDVLDAYLAG
ncbi:MAG TPA: ABC transporter ATP-binding protein [Acidimicrobiales bacterium]|nr:ABC transporter ATP-binding protein [Acidimicrobiales bacterium]